MSVLRKAGLPARLRLSCGMCYRPVVQQNPPRSAYEKLCRNVSAIQEVFMKQQLNVPMFCFPFVLFCFLLLLVNVGQGATRHNSRATLQQTFPPS